MSVRPAHRETGFLLAMLVLSSSLQAGAQTCADYARRFHWLSRVDFPGTLVNLAVRPPYGYLTDEDYGLRVLDIADPRHPVELASLPLPGVPWDIVLHGTYACVSVFDQGLTVVDISNPAAPTFAGSVWTGSSIGLAVSDDYVLLADFMAMRVFTISLADPAHPEIVGELQTPGWAWDVAVSGKLAIVTATYTVVIADISDPLDPRRVGSVGVPDAIYDVAIEGHSAFIAGAAKFYVVDFEDPTHPALIANIDVPSVNCTVAVKDGFAFLGRQENGVTVFDVRDPVHPTPVGHFAIDGRTWAWGIAFAEDLMYVVDRWHGIHVLDVANPMAVQPLARVGTPDPRPYRIAVADSYAYVANVEEGLVVADLTVPTSPSIIAHVNTGGVAWGVAHEDQRVYLACDDAGLEVFDVANPADPIRLGSTPTGGSASCVSVLNGFAYVANGSGGFCIVDVGDPADPRVVGTLSMDVNDIEVHGNGACLTGAGGVTVVDVSDPTFPRVLSSLDVGFPLRCVTGNERYAYVGGDGDDFKGYFAVVSLEDPIHPTVLARVPTLRGVRDVEQRGNFVWLAEDDMPVLIMDVSDPRDPRIIGYVELADYMGDYTWDVAVADRFVLGGSTDELKVLPCHLPLRPVSGPPDPKPPLPENLATVVSGPSAGVQLRFETAATGPAEVVIVDPTGRIVRELASAGAADGHVAPYWDFKNMAGQRVAPGIYFARLTGAARTQTRRLIVLR